MNELISSENLAKVVLDLSNYLTKVCNYVICLILLKNAARVETSDCAKKSDLANSKSEFDKIDIDQLEKVPTGLNSLKSKVDKLDDDKLGPVPLDLSKLSDVVKINVAKKTEYNE